MLPKRLPKLLKLLVPIGLIAGLAVLLARRRRRWNLWNRSVVKFSSYRDLLPYLIAMSKVETADLTSSVYEGENNLFGMKTASKRPQLGRPGRKAPDGGTYQHYTTDTQGIRDWFLWADYTKFPKSVSSREQFNRELFNRKYYGISEAQYLKLLQLYA